MDDRHPYAIYRSIVHESATRRGTIPHCDSDILHALGSCIYCDGRTELHKAREVLRINYTGQHDKDKLLCPAEVGRSTEKMELWYGNIPRTQKEHDQWVEDLRRELRELMEE
jgi:hypothetical protein